MSDKDFPKAFAWHNDNTDTLLFLSESDVAVCLPEKNWTYADVTCEPISHLWLPIDPQPLIQAEWQRLMDRVDKLAPFVPFDMADRTLFDAVNDVYKQAVPGPTYHGTEEDGGAK